MPYTIPTSEQFLTRFPIFGDTDTSLVDVLLSEAASNIDTTWFEDDYQPAIMYLAAHLLATDNSSEDDDVNIGPEGSGVISSVSLGPLSVTYGTRSQSNAGGVSQQAMESPYGSTEYGRRFYVYLIRNAPNLLVI